MFVKLLPEGAGQADPSFQPQVLNRTLGNPHPDTNPTMHRSTTTYRIAVQCDALAFTDAMHSFFSAAYTIAVV